MAVVDLERWSELDCCLDGEPPDRAGVSDLERGPIPPRHSFWSLGWSSSWICPHGPVCGSIIGRRLRYGGGQHDTIGVYDRITRNFIRYVAGYRRHMAPRVHKLIADHAGDAQVVVLRSDAPRGDTS